ncbi:MAG: protein TolR [Pseudomonadota bacterium]|nr:protein TolR [Gammaproteobacteria bacterium]MBU1733570.1 protein TolR [Gammaproteobacteria bacterium]MBU1891714.1 protein TolR [Gammaproteobacteria bacterium]
MSLRRQRKLMNQINVVPYIDVMLVLLIIFMITAPLINPGQIELPQVGQALKPPVAPLEITIKEDKRLLLRDRETSRQEQEVTRDDLVQAVKEKQEKNPEQAVVIAADKNVRYEEVLNVMDILQQNQVQKIGLLAKPKGQ